MLLEYTADASLADQRRFLAGVSSLCDLSTQDDRILFEFSNDAFGAFRLPIVFTKTLNDRFALILKAYLEAWLLVEVKPEGRCYREETSC